MSIESVMLSKHLILCHCFLSLFAFNLFQHQASLVAQLVTNMPAMRETWAWSVGWEDSLEKAKAIHSSILAWRISWTLQSMGLHKVRHNWATFTFTFPAMRVFSNESALPIRWSNTGASASVLPMNIQGWFPLGLTGLISGQSKGLSRVFHSTIAGKHEFFDTQPFLWFNSHIHTWLLGKP